MVPLITIIMVLPDRFTSLTWVKSTCRLSGNEEFYKSMSFDYVTLPDILHELCQTKDVLIILLNQKSHLQVQRIFLLAFTFHEPSWQTIVHISAILPHSCL